MSSMFQSLWKQVVGDSEDSSSDTSIHHHHRQNRRSYNNNNNNNRSTSTTTSKEDEEASMLLSQFPPFGVFSQSKQKNSFEDTTTTSTTDDHPEEDQEDTFNNNNNNKAASNSNHDWQSSYNHPSSSGRRKGDDDSVSIASSSTYSIFPRSNVSTLSFSRTNNSALLLPTTTTIVPEEKKKKKKEESSSPLKKEEEEDEEMTLWHSKKSSRNSKQRPTTKKKKKKRKQKRNRNKNKRLSSRFYWEKRQDWVQQGPIVPTIKVRVPTPNNNNNNNNTNNTNTNNTIPIKPRQFHHPYVDIPMNNISTAVSTSTSPTAPSSPSSTTEPFSPNHHYHYSNRTTKQFTSPRDYHLQRRPSSTTTDDDDDDDCSTTGSSSSLLSDSDDNSESSSSTSSLYDKNKSHYNNNNMCMSMSGIGSSHRMVSSETSSSLSRVGGGWKSKNPAAAMVMATTTTTTSEEKQHWMPDKLCKQCYSCDVPFSVFRRRHHCRVCGQVFCSTCSAYFVDIGSLDHPPESSSNTNTTTTATQQLFEKVTSVKLGTSKLSSPNNNTTNNNNNNNNNNTTTSTTITQSSSSRRSSGDSSSNHHKKDPTSTITFSSSSTSSSSSAVRTIRTCKTCYDQLLTTTNIHNHPNNHNNNSNSNVNANNNTNATTGTLFLSPNHLSSSQQQQQQQQPTTITTQKQQQDKQQSTTTTPIRNFTTTTTTTTGTTTSQHHSTTTESMLSLRNKFFHPTKSNNNNNNNTHPSSSTDNRTNTASSTGDSNTNPPTVTPMMESANNNNHHLSSSDNNHNNHNNHHSNTNTSVMRNSKQSQQSQQQQSSSQQQQSSQSQQLFAGHDGHWMNVSDDESFHNLNMVKQKLDQVRLQNIQLQNQAAAEAAAAAAAAATASATSNEKHHNTLMIGKRISSTVSRRFGRLAEQAAAKEQLLQQDDDDIDTKLIGTGVRKLHSVDETQQQEEEAEEDIYQLHNHDNVTITKQKTSFPSLTTNYEDEILSNDANSDEDAILTEDNTTLSSTSKNNNKDNEKNTTATSSRSTTTTTTTAMTKKENNKKANQEEIKHANRFLGQIAADHLERMGRELLRSEAPLLLSLLHNNNTNKKKCDILLDRWVEKLMILATRCCATVESNIQGGDLLDIRPYCKIKVIPGGSLHDSVYMSGVIFHKNVSHKAMSKEIYNPRIMLLSGGIEYRMENRIASLDTLLEQEEKYMEILVNKITKLKPDILIAGRSVSRKAQELLLKAKIILIQRVKPSLMKRIARQTGATILLSVDHVMNQFGSTILGKCSRFRLVTFRDNEKWKDHRSTFSEEDPTCLESENNTIENNEGNIPGLVNYVDSLLSKKDIPNHKRQEVLAANSLGEKVHDGSDVVKYGLAKRGVTNTYVMMEGCPKHLGCTVVLRGANLAALKQVKRVFAFLVNVAYNLKLETSFLRDRRAKLPSDYTLPESPLTSSSLCIDYGNPPIGKRARPWNGGNQNNDTNNSKQQRSSSSGKITALDHQSILITSVWMTGKTQCCPAEVKGICYYSQQDVSLGQFLRDSCFNLSLKCQNPSCTKSVLDHSLSFVHNDGLIRITVEQMEKPLPPGPETYSAETNKQSAISPEKTMNMKNTAESPIATWTYCNNCSKVVTPLVYISKETWKLSFGKFLEVFFYNKVAILNVPQHRCCNCVVQTNTVLYFGCGDLAARFTYERIRPYGVYVRRFLPDNGSYHRDHSYRQLESITPLSTDLFDRFNNHIQNISGDALQLFKSTANKLEHVQTVVSELNLISSEVEHAANILQNKISSVTARFQQLSLSDNIMEPKLVVYNDTLLQFPWHCRRYLFMLASAWNERLSAIGQALEPMKKLAASSQNSSNGGRGDTSQNLSQSFVGDGNNEDFSAGMKRLHQLREVYSKFNLDEMIIHPFPSTMVDEDDLDQSRRGKKSNDPDILHQDDDDDLNSDYVAQLDSEFNFAEEIDADVLASRRLYAQKIESSTRRRSSVQSPNQRRSSDDTNDDILDSLQMRSRPASLSRSDSGATQTNVLKPYDIGSLDASFTKTPNKSKAVSAGGAVKSALNRFFNRGNKESDPYVIDLGDLGKGRPKLEPGIEGSVIPVIDDKPSTIIAHSLSSIEYDVQFKQFIKTDGLGFESSQSNHQENTMDDFTKGSKSVDQIQKDKILSRQGSGVKRSSANATTALELRREIERQMLVRNKSHIKHTFRDFDDKGQQLCKFSCTTYWATQFQAVRQAFMSSAAFSDLKEVQSGNDAPNALSAHEVEKSYIRSLMASQAWEASGGKSGASFARTDDGRFVVKCISRTELQMFLDCAPAYFEYLTKAFFHGLPTVLCKIVGVYQIGYHNRVTGKRTMEQVAVMQNIFFERKISKVFDLKGSLRGRFTQRLKVENEKKDAEKTSNETQSTNAASKIANSSRKVKRHESGSTDDYMSSDDDAEGNAYDSENSSGQDSEVDDTLLIDNNNNNKKNSVLSDSLLEKISKEPVSSTMLDGDFLEFTGGRPLPLNDRAKAVFHMSILNDTLFLSIINVLDYSILIGIDEEKKELVVGIIDFMRQYDILKQMERVGKSIPMVVGSEAPTIIQPPLYKARFTNAMERYFMTVPSKWTVI